MSDKKHYYVYVIRSLSSDYHYIGFTHNLEKRLVEHNKGKTPSNKCSAPFKLIYLEGFNDMSRAVKRERYLKSSHMRQLFRNIV